MRATEQASNTIMECAEALMGADASDPAAYKALVDEKMMVIFEACSFQDITGSVGLCRFVLAINLQRNLCQS